MHVLRRWTHTILQILYYATLPTNHWNLNTNLAISPCTKECQLQASFRPRPRRYTLSGWSPISQRGKGERRTGWEEKRMSSKKKVSWQVLVCSCALLFQISLVNTHLLCLYLGQFPFWCGINSPANRTRETRVLETVSYFMAQMVEWMVVAERSLVPISLELHLRPGSKWSPLCCKWW